MDELVDDVDGRLEASTGDESDMHEYDSIQEPYVGMIFESEEAAKIFYENYARQRGFFTRVLSSHKSELDGLLISRGLGCRGYFDNQTEVQLQKQEKQRESCSAMIHLRRDKTGRWVIKKFVRDHNHPLVIRLEESCRRLDEEKDKKIQELTAELRVKKRLSASYREQLVAFMKEVEDHNYHISMKVQATLDNLKTLDAKAHELLHGDESGLCELNLNQEPHEGMLFESVQAAKAFYDEYARRVGFLTRIISSRKSELDGSIIHRRLACNKEGFNLNRQKNGRVQIRKRESKREGCMARMIVKREKPGRWVISKFVKEHTHPLLITSVNGQPNPMQQDDKDKKIQELSSELVNANQELMACREQLCAFMNYIEEHTEHLSKTVEGAVQNIRELECRDNSCHL